MNKEKTHHGSEVTVSIPIDTDELWYAVFGSGWENHDWWSKIVYKGDTAWDKAGKVILSIANPEGDSNGKSRVVTRTLDVEDLKRALSITMAKGYRDACTGRSEWLSFEYDSCEGDAILQVAIFGEVIYG